MGPGHRRSRPRSHREFGGEWQGGELRQQEHCGLEGGGGSSWGAASRGGVSSSHCRRAWRTWGRAAISGMMEQGAVCSFLWPRSREEALGSLCAQLLLRQILTQRTDSRTFLRISWTPLASAYSRRVSLLQCTWPGLFFSLLGATSQLDSLWSLEAPGLIFSTPWSKDLFTRLCVEGCPDGHLPWHASHLPPIPDPRQEALRTGPCSWQGLSRRHVSHLG